MPTLRSRKSIDYAAEAPKYRIVSKTAVTKAKSSKTTKASKAGSKGKKVDAASDRAPLQALSGNPAAMMAQGAIVMMGGAMAPPDSDSIASAGNTSKSKRSREDASTASSTSSGQKKSKQASSSGPSRSKAKRAKSSATEIKATEPVAALTGGLSSLCNLSAAQGTQGNAPASPALLTSPPRTDAGMGEGYGNLARDVTSDIAAILQAPTPAPKGHRAARTTAAAAAKAEAAGWRRRFESLRELRTTEAEARLEAAQKAAAQCQTAQAQLIAHQKEQIERLSEELKSAQKAANARAAAPNARASGGGGGNGAAERECGRLRAELSAEQRNNEQLNDMLDTHRAVVGAYRTISGIGISLVQSTEAERASGSTRVQCTAINRTKKLAAKYELLLPQDRDGQIEYTPGGNAHLLPEYMRDEIEFSWGDAPAMTRRVLSSIFG